MKRPRRTRLRASFVTLALLVVAMQTAVTAQIMPADSGATDAATVVPAGGTMTAQPVASSSSSASDSTTGSSDSTSASTSASSTASSATQSSADSGVDTSTSDSVGVPIGLTLSPISSDDGDTDTGANTDTSNTGSEPTNASTSSGKADSFGGWKLAIVIAGAVCAVVASIFLVHMRHVRTVAANKRPRGSSQRRALDSFFRQNRVTVPRETGISSGIFVTDPLTPRDEIAVTIPSNNLPRTKTVDLIAGSAAQAFNRRTRPAGSSGSIDTPTDSYNGNGYDSFTGRNHTPSIVSVASSNAYNSNSVYSDTSSISLGSIAPSVSSSQRSFAPSGLSDQFTRPRLQTVASQGRSSKRASSATSIGDGRDTNRSDRSSSDFSVFNTSVASTEEDIYRISTQLIDVSAIPATTSEKSEPNSKDSYHSNDRLSGLSEFSVDESYTSDLSVHERFGTELSIDNDSLSFSTADSFGTADSYTTGSSNGTTDSLLDRDSVVFRNSKESELSEGEI
ncbi:hypothetical protein PRNP1_011780 [Phytophthora ramorum]